MESQPHQFGQARRLLATLVALVAVLGTGGLHTARAADGVTLTFETRLCPSPAPLSGLDWFNGCTQPTNEVPAFRVTSPQGPNTGFSLPVSFYGSDGHFRYHPASIPMTDDERTITIKQVGTAALRLVAVECWWESGKAWDGSPFRLPQQNQSATLSWSLPTPQGPYPLSDLHCFLLFISQPQPSL